VQPICQATTRRSFFEWHFAQFSTIRCAISATVVERFVAIISLDQCLDKYARRNIDPTGISVPNRRRRARAAWIVPRIIEALTICVRLRVIGRMEQHAIAKIPSRLVIGLPCGLGVRFRWTAIGTPAIQHRHRAIAARSTTAGRNRPNNFHRRHGHTHFARRNLATSARHQHQRNQSSMHAEIRSCSYKPEKIKPSIDSEPSIDKAGISGR
jgi:hypothetical protein